MIWQALKRLEALCDTEIRSSLKHESDALAWRVWIRHRERTAEPPIVVTMPELQDAVTEAVGDAQRRGWVSN